MGDKAKGFLKIENVRTVASPIIAQPATPEAGSNVVYVLPGGQSVSGQQCIQMPAQSLQNVVQNHQGQSFVRVQVGQQVSNGQAVIQLPAGHNLSETTFVQVPATQNTSEQPRFIHLPINQATLQMPAAISSFTSAASEAGSLPSLTSQGKNLQVDHLLDNLIKNNEEILKKNDASAFKPRTRETLEYTPKFTPSPVSTSRGANKTDYPLMKHFLNTNNPLPASTFAAVPLSSIKPKEEDVAKMKQTVQTQFIRMQNVVARPRSPTRRCKLLQTDESLFMNSFVETRVKKKDSWPLNLRIKDIVCGLSARAKVMLPGQGTLALDGNVYWCNFCPFTSESKPAFLSHVMIHRFSCKHCKFQAFSRAEVVRHSSIKHCHYDEIPWYYCSFFHDNLKLHCHNNSVAEGSVEQFNDKDYAFIDMTIETLAKDEDDLEDDDDDDDDEDLATMARIAQGEQPQQKNGTSGNLLSSALSSSPIQKATTSTESTTHKTADVQKSPIQTEAPSEGWSKVSWICSYCDFVSQNYDLIKVHCSIMHPSESVSANQTKVSAEMAAQIKQLDSIRQLHLDKGQKEFLLSTDSNNSASAKPKPKPKVVMTSPVIPPAGKSKAEPVKTKKVPVRNERPVEPTTSENKSATDVRSYECYNCHGQTIKIEELRSHLTTEHCGEPYVGIDLRSVRLKQARFIVFCATPSCSFTTRFVQQYIDHYKTCFPDWNVSPNIEHDTHRSIVTTIKFAVKNMQVKLRGKMKTKWFYCLGCQFKATKIGQVKRHVKDQHKTRKPAYQYVHVSSRGKTKATIYFCPQCNTFESQAYTPLQTHLKIAHNMKNLKLMYRQSEPDLDNLQEENMEPEDDSSVSMDADSENQDVKPTPEQLESMMDAYLEGETTTKLASLGTNSRHAAVKAQLKLKNQGNQPHLHRCRSCSYQCLGVHLMRVHIETEHPGSDLISQDMKKKSRRQASNVFLCCKTGCSFTACVYGEVQSHAQEEHKIEMGELKEPLKSPSEIKLEPHGSLETGSYMCLYCKIRVTFSTTFEMREHVKDNHPGEEIVMRDLSARKNSMPCRLYMCSVDTCSFSTPNKDLSIEHMQMHHDLTDMNESDLFEADDENAGDVITHDEIGDEENEDDENIDNETDENVEEEMELNEEDLSLPLDIEVQVNEDNDMEDL